MTVYTPNDELVLITWLKTYAAGLDAYTATSLPDPLPFGGFVTVRALAIATANIDISKRRSAICSLDCWAPPGGSGSDKPRWGQAWNLHSVINDALDNEVQEFGTVLNFPTIAADSYRPAVVFSVWATTTPRRVENDPNAYAHLTFDVEIDWAVLPA